MSEMNDIYNVLRRIGKEVRKKADKGHKLSLDLMAWYKLHHDCPADPGAQAIVTDLTMAWLDAFPGINKRTWKNRHKVHSS